MKITKLLIVSFFLLSTFCFSQSKSKKLDVIIKELYLIETAHFTLENDILVLKYQVTGNDSLKLSKIEQSLSDEDIYKRVSKGVETFFTKKEINDLYNFFTSSANKKLSDLREIEKEVFSNFSDIYHSIEEVKKAIDKKDIKKQSRSYLPIPVDRENGVYATSYFDGDIERIEIVKTPAVVFSDIDKLEIEHDYLGKIYLNITLNEQGKRKLYHLTKENIDKPIAIVIDKKIISTPLVLEPVTNGRIPIYHILSEEELYDIKEKLTQE